MWPSNKICFPQSLAFIKYLKLSVLLVTLSWILLDEALSSIINFLVFLCYFSFAATHSVILRLWVNSSKIKNTLSLRHKLNPLFFLFFFFLGILLPWQLFYHLAHSCRWSIHSHIDLLYFPRLPGTVFI